jgi:U3 small nucleolar RNA-associated protein 10
MTTSLSKQLNQIAAKSTNSLNLKAQRTKHSQSIIFPPTTAASQDFDTIYAICYEGFHELCLLDARFVPFNKSLFADSSKSVEREQRTEAENKELDDVIESFLGLVGARLNLQPAVKAVEWLVRRFRVHEYNTQWMLLTFLPYHTAQIFKTLLSILPKSIPPTLKFLNPYIKGYQNPPRHAIVYSAINNVPFSSALNSYVLRICKSKHQHHSLLSFWAGVMTEAVAGMLDQARSGRANVQKEREEDVVLRILPVLNEGLNMKKAADLHLGCYMLITVLAAKMKLQEEVLSAMMEAIVGGWTVDTVDQGLVSLALLAQEREGAKLPRSVVKALVKVDGIEAKLAELSNRFISDKLLFGLLLNLTGRPSKYGLHGLKIVETILMTGMPEYQTRVAIRSIMLAAQTIEPTEESDEELRGGFIGLIQRLIASSNTSKITEAIMQEAEIDMDQLELSLQTVFALTPAESSPDLEDVDMTDAPLLKSRQPNLEDALKHVPKRTVNEDSFLSRANSHVFPPLKNAFLIAVSSKSKDEDLKAFSQLPIFTEHGSQESLPISFYIRIWSGPYPVLARSAALQLAEAELDGKIGDLQCLLPFLIIALADPAVRVRRAASRLILSMRTMYKSISDDDKQKSVVPWGMDSIYGANTKETKATQWLDIKVASSLIADLLGPNLEECILDASHLGQILARAIGAPAPMAQSSQSAPILKQSSRTSLLAFLANYVYNSSQYDIKFNLLTILNKVDRVGSTTRTSLLLPVLESWISLDQNHSTSVCEVSNVDVQAFDEQAVAIIVAGDSAGIQILHSIVSKGSARPHLVKSALARFRTLWPFIKIEDKLSTAQFLLGVGLGNLGRVATEYEGDALDVLRNVTLPTDVLVALVDGLPLTPAMKDQAPASKRRRTSHNQAMAVNPQAQGELAQSIRHVTVVLELIESSSPEKHTQLLRGLFQLLGQIQFYKLQVGNELGYLQGLILSSLLAILNYTKTSAAKLDQSAVRADLIVDCVRTTSSPQVQNAALLLVSSLAVIAPGLVLHSVMPIFTFMGATILRQDDEYSAHVIDQTIHRVIPPLLDSLRKQTDDPVTSAAELLLSFVAAYEHIPLHRRLKLFAALTRTLGADDFLFAILAMLLHKYQDQAGVEQFALDLAAQFGSETQLLTISKYLDLVIDVVKTETELPEKLLTLSQSGRNRTISARKLLEPLSAILSAKRLVALVEKTTRADDMDAARQREIFTILLEKILSFADDVKKEADLHDACSDLLEPLLSLLSTVEFVKSINNLLEQPDKTVRRNILKTLQHRIRSENLANESSRLAILGILPGLNSIVESSPDVLFKHTAISCIDLITEKYGKKDPDAILRSAEIIIGPAALDHSDSRVRVLSLLCLATMTDVLGDRFMPVLPHAFSKATAHLESSITASPPNEELHNAAFSFLAGLLVHISWILAGSYLDRIIKLSHESVYVSESLTQQAIEMRIDVLSLIAKKIEAKECFEAIARNFGDATTPEAVKEHLGMLDISIERFPKSVVMKNATALTGLLLEAFDIRRNSITRVSHDTSADIEDVENLAVDIACKMVFKMNDSTFRPIFTKIFEWSASSLPKKDKRGRILRAMTFYHFFDEFLERLKSIVTSYYSYVLENSIEVLANVEAGNVLSEKLWTMVLGTLVKAFTYDQDGMIVYLLLFEAIY